jgi:ABC-type spermidine/putrescine transport system permease subunit I
MTSSEGTTTGGISGVLYRLRKLPERRKGLAVALPPFVFLALFFLVPLLTVLSFSVRVQRDLQMTSELTLEPYLTVLTGETFRSALLYSIQISLITTLITLVFGLPVGYYLAVRVSDRFRNVLVFLIIAPLWINFFVRAYAIIQIGGARGFLNGALLAVGLIDEPIRWFVYSQESVIFGLSALWLPLMVLPIYAMLQQMDTAWLEAARDLGAGPLRVHREVTIPSALPGIILGSLFVFLLSLGNQAVPRILGGAKRTTYSETILLQLESGGLNWPVASAASGVMMAFVVVVLIGVFSVFDMEELF